MRPMGMDDASAAIEITILDMASPSHCLIVPDFEICSLLIAKNRSCPNIRSSNTVLPQDMTTSGIIKSKGKKKRLINCEIISSFHEKF